MHKVCLLVLSLGLFGSGLHAGENKDPNIKIDSLRSRRASVDASQSKPDDVKAVAADLKSLIKESKLLVEEVKSLSVKVNFLRSYMDKRIEERKEAEGIIFEQINEHKAQCSQQVKEVKKEAADFKTSAIQAAASFKASLNSRVVETGPHDVQPAIDALTSQLKDLSEKVTTCEGQLQSAATQEDFEQAQMALEKIRQTIAQLPTLEQVRDEMTDAAEGFLIASKGYTDEHFATKNEMAKTFQRQHKAYQSAVNTLKENITEIKKQIAAETKKQELTRNADLDRRRLQNFKKKMVTKKELEGVVREEDDNSVVRQKDLDAKGFATAEQLEEVKRTIPTVENPQGLVKQVDVDALQEQIREVKALIPNIDDLAKKNYVDQTAKALEDQLENKANKSDLNDYAKKGDLNDYVPLKTHQETVMRLQEQIEQNDPKKLLKSGVIYFAKQGALGCAAYKLSPYTASLLRTLKLENDYVDLETVAVPVTTGAISLLTRLTQEVYEKREKASLKEVAKESALDAGASAGVMGLRYICFNDEMNTSADRLSEQTRTAGYGLSYALLRSIVALFL